MKAAKTVTLGDRSFEVRPLPATRALKLFYRLGRVLGPSLAAMSGTAGAAATGISGMPAEAFGRAISILCEKLDDTEVDTISNAFLTSCAVTENGRRSELDTAMINTMFAGNLLDMHKLLAAALEVNYGDFLGALGLKEGLAGLTISRS